MRFLQLSRRVATHVARRVAGIVASTLAATLAVMFFVEASIQGGFRAVLIPIEAPGSPRQERLVETYHLNDSVFERYVRWVGDVLQGDWGVSTTRSTTAVTELIWPRVPISFELMVVSVAVTLLLGIPLGLLAAARRGKAGESVLNASFGLAQSVPVFITPVILIWLFALQLQWLPAAGWVRLTNSPTDNLWHLVLPVAALVSAEVGIVARIVRADVLRVMATDYYTAATGKGLSQRYLLTRHALRPASLGLLNVVGLNVSALLSGTLIVELIFGLPGLGQVLLEATTARDLYVLLALTTYFVVVAGTINALVDAAMVALDPRLATGPTRRQRSLRAVFSNR